MMARNDKQAKISRLNKNEFRCDLDKPMLVVLIPTDLQGRRMNNEVRVISFCRLSRTQAVIIV